MILKAIRNNIVPAGLALIFFMTVFPFIGSVMEFSRSSAPAIEWRAVQVLTPVVRPGEILSFVYEARVDHRCPADLRKFIMNEAGDIMVRFPVDPGGQRERSNEFIRTTVNVKIPLTTDEGNPDWTTGNYTYRMAAVRFCETWIEYDTLVPDVHFKIEVPS